MIFKKILEPKYISFILILILSISLFGDILYKEFLVIPLYLMKFIFAVLQKQQQIT